MIYFIFCTFVSRDGLMSSETFQPQQQRCSVFGNVGLSFHQRTETLNNYQMNLTFTVLRGWILLALVDFLFCFVFSPLAPPWGLTYSWCHRSVSTTTEWTAMKFILLVHVWYYPVPLKSSIHTLLLVSTCPPKDKGDTAETSELAAENDVVS